MTALNFQAAIRLKGAFHLYAYKKIIGLRGHTTITFGEMHLQQGSIAVCGTLAYVPQQAWIFFGTVQENILMGESFEKDRYDRVLNCCSLKVDLKILPHGDQTVIGEGGINLSGGQKQRISLARAVYSDRDIFLLDDPLSAVDAHVGKHIFEECIKKELRGKSIILVTHQLQVIASPMSFFDSTPVGQLLNRFSKDQDELDVMIPVQTDSTLLFFSFLSCTLGTIALSMPPMVVPMVLSMGLVTLLLIVSHRGIRHLKRTEDMSRSPWMSFTVSTVQGLSTIQAYDKKDCYIQRHVKEAQVPDDWPQHGSITFQDYKMRYRENTPIVLNGLQIHINAGEKVGIVGRTGSGKSSLGVALFRLVEPAEGSILIDGVDITRIGLQDLRRKMSIIPQDPVLFVGTIRYNLDPFNKHSDEELWDALEKTCLKDAISRLPDKLQAEILRNGENFSLGQKQLMYGLIQDTIREVFQSCTTLTIAHRLNTVLQSDRILVMDQGQVVEFDHPDVLRQKPDSLFSALLAAANTVDAK
ncbi:hypothetical protein CRUP_025519 [Coryphaenoides rupestris]|nr:hypothetical protein CRUP_025519 [Coryphaenoides rupestris]